MFKIKSATGQLILNNGSLVLGDCCCNSGRCCDCSTSWSLLATHSSAGGIGSDPGKPELDEAIYNLHQTYNSGIFCKGEDIAAFYGAADESSISNLGIVTATASALEAGGYTNVEILVDKGSMIPIYIDPNNVYPGDEYFLDACPGGTYVENGYNVVNVVPLFDFIKVYVSGTCCGSMSGEPLDLPLYYRWSGTVDNGEIYNTYDSSYWKNYGPIYSCVGPYAYDRCRDNILAKDCTGSFSKDESCLSTDCSAIPYP